MRATSITESGNQRRLRLPERGKSPTAACRPRAPGKDIIQYGYGPVTRAVIEYGLLDELRLWLHPILVGKGTVDNLLMGPRATATLKLADVQRYDSGLLILTYQPVSR